METLNRSLSLSRIIELNQLVAGISRCNQIASYMHTKVHLASPVKINNYFI